MWLVGYKVFTWGQGALIAYGEYTVTHGYSLWKKSQTPPPLAGCGVLLFSELPQNAVSGLSGHEYYHYIVHSNPLRVLQKDAFVGVSGAEICYKSCAI